MHRTTLLPVDLMRIKVVTLSFLHLFISQVGIGATINGKSSEFVISYTEQILIIINNNLLPEFIYSHNLALISV